MSELNISVSTTSSTIPWPWPSAPYAVPSITVNGAAVTPANASNSPSGYQMVLYDLSQLAEGKTDPIFNDYFRLFPNSGSVWMTSYLWMYQHLDTTYLVTANMENYLMILTSYGLDNNMAPTNGALEVLFNLGSGSVSQDWIKNSDPGSQMGNSSYWTATPGNYIFVGVAGRGYGQAPGEIHQVGEFNKTLSTSLSATVGF